VCSLNGKRTAFIVVGPERLLVFGIICYPSPIRFQTIRRVLKVKVQASTSSGAYMTSSVIMIIVEFLPGEWKLYFRIKHIPHMPTKCIHRVKESCI